MLIIKIALARQVTWPAGLAGVRVGEAKNPGPAQTSFVYGVEKGGKRYYGATEQREVRLGKHNSGFGSAFVGPGPHEIVLDETTNDWPTALLEEVVGFAGGCAALGGASLVRGGPFPGDKMFPRERREADLLKNLFLGGGLRERLYALRGETRASARLAGLPKTWEHLVEMCWGCKKLGHRRGDKLCPLSAGKRAQKKPAVQRRTVEKEKKKKKKKTTKKALRAKYKKYNPTEKGRARTRTYLKTKKGRKTVTKKASTYNQTEKGKKRASTYAKSEKGKKARAEATQAWRDRQ